MARGQEVILLHVFGDGSIPNDGSEPASGLIEASNGFFYGTTPMGGSDAEGTIFEVSSQGQTMILHNFNNATGTVNDVHGNPTRDGDDPAAGLIQGPDGSFYGTTVSGGGTAAAPGDGTVFKITPQGLEIILHSFGDGSVVNDGTEPEANLVQGSDGNFYGTTSSGGSASKGTVFKITPAGVVTILHSFGDGSGTGDGTMPTTGLIQASDGNFYGTMSNGGTAGDGMVYKITPQGQLTILHSFGDGSVVNDGQDPEASLVQAADGNFYGTTFRGGPAIDSSGTTVGTVFKITPQGVVTILHMFGQNGTVASNGLSSDGSFPQAPLIQGADGNFYGTTVMGGSAAEGTVFKITPQGVLTNFINLSVANSDESPMQPLVQGSDGNFYFTTPDGDVPFEAGTVVKISPYLPALTSAAVANGTVGLPFSYQPLATNQVTSYSVANLPPGLTMNPNTGLITGTPTTVANTLTTLTMTNFAGSFTVQFGFKIVALPVPAVTSILYAFGSVGSAFTYTTTATNIATSYSETGLDGTGLMLDPATGIISGTPTAAGTISVSLTATNLTGDSTAVTLTIQITATTPSFAEEFATLYKFGISGSAPVGVTPNSIIQGFDGTFYGTTVQGPVNAGGGIVSPGITKAATIGSGGNTSGGLGVVFHTTVQGTTSILAPFSAGAAVDGFAPTGLVQAANGNFYGMTKFGGTAGLGTIFHVTLTGTKSVLHSFGDGSIANDGATPLSTLIQGSDGNFYGTTSAGGAAGLGTVFQVNLAGVVTILHSFGDGSVLHDGATPEAALYQGADGNFYGTTYAGGSAGDGTIFKITPQGTETVLHHFGDGTVANDGANSIASLIQDPSGLFYGVTGGNSITTPGGGGSANHGTVFTMTPGGLVTILHSFGDGTVTNDGSSPLFGLILGYDGNYYGTTSQGGATQDGTVFEITPMGMVTIIFSFNGTDGINPTSLIQATDGNFYGVTTLGGTGTAPGYGTIFTLAVQQMATHVPVFFGSAYASSGLDSALIFTPKVEFGVSSAGNKPGGIFSQLATLLADVVQPAFAQTNWTLTGNLPNDLTFDTTSGTISGTPVQAGTFHVTMTPHNALGDGTPQPITIYIDVPPTINSPSTALGTEQTPFIYAITGLPDATTYGATNLPGWLAINVVTGLLSGTPPGPGAYGFTAIATNYAGSGSEQVVVTVNGTSSAEPAITSATAVNGTAGTPLFYQIEASNNPTSYRALNLPTGVTCNLITGLISGTPTVALTSSASVSATNSAGTTNTDVTFTIAPSGPPTLPAMLFLTVAPNVSISYQIPSTGLVGIYDAVGLPMGLSVKPSSGVISGTPTGMLTSNVTLTATNSSGSAMAMLTLTVVPLMTKDYIQWEGQFPFNGSITAITEQDGVTNLFKYLCDINPTMPLTSTERAELPSAGIDTTSTPGTKYATLTFQEYQSLTGVTMHFQTSPNLKSWTTVTPTLNQVVGANSSTGDPIMEMGVSYTSANAPFVRLQVTSP